MDNNSIKQLTNKDNKKIKINNTKKCTRCNGDHNDFYCMYYKLT